MNRAHTASLLAIALFVSITPSMNAQTDRGHKTDVVATVAGKDLTMADMQHQEGGKLLQADYQYYLSRRKVLEDLIDNQLLEDAARSKNMPLDQFMEKEVYKNVKDPTEDQLQVYYEGLDTKDSYEAIRGEVLQHIRELREGKARIAYVDELRKQANINITLMPPVADVRTDHAYARGSLNAPVVMIEFADYECPYCQKVNPQVQQLKKTFGDNLTVVYKDFPLPMHHGSQKAAEAARCAGEQNKFWEYHDVLFYSKMVEVDDLKKHAQVLNLDTERFDKCLDDGVEATAVKKDLEEAKSLGLTGTPSFFVNGHFFSGVVDYNVLRDMVNQQLNMENRQNPAHQLSQSAVGEASSVR